MNLQLKKRNYELTHNLILDFNTVIMVLLAAIHSFSKTSNRREVNDIVRSGS